MERTRTIEPRRAWWVTGALTALTVLLVGVTGDLHDAAVPGWLAVPVLAFGFAAVERWPLPVRRGHEAQFYSLAELPLTLGLLLVHPLALVLGRIVGQVVALYVRRRQSAEKLAFNIALGAVEVAAGYATVAAVVDPSRTLELRGAIALLCAALVVDVVSNVGLTAVLSAVEGRVRVDLLRPGLVAGLAPAIASASLSFLAVRLITDDVWLAAPLAAVLTLVVLAFRAHTALEAQNLGLERVSGFTSTMGVEQATISHVRDLLDDARTVLHAGLVELTIESPPGWHHLAGTAPAQVEGASVLAALPEPPTKATVVPAARATRRATRLQRATGLRDAIVVPLPPGGSVRGWLVVADRDPGLSTFTAADLVVAEAVAGHLAVAYANAHLADELRVRARESEQRARHDLLTGLPNRSALLEHCRSLPADAVFSLLLLDLDRFKEVNDTLGHAAGDDLLVQVAGRIRARIGSGPLITRLGGDEFAVVVAGTVAEGMVVGEQIVGALARPFTLSGVEVQIGVSVGVAHSPTHGSSTGDLLKHADVAMYKAKQSQSGVGLYALVDDETTQRQLQLSTDLPVAIAEGHVCVDAAPVTSLRTRRLLRHDAVARWVHPVHGVVPADELQSMAERSGLVRELTVHLARRALESCADQRAGGAEVGAGLRLSGRMIVDQSLPDLLTGILRDVGLPAAALTVEVPEPSLLVDPERAAPVLRQLSGTGIRVVLAAFGTSHSSLPQLAVMGLQALRIDAHVVARREQPQGEAVLRAMIDVGHHLGLSVEADGVHDEATLAWLLTHGCDAGQGRLLGGGPTVPGGDRTVPPPQPATRLS